MIRARATKARRLVLVLFAALLLAVAFAGSAEARLGGGGSFSSGHSSSGGGGGGSGADLCDAIFLIIELIELWIEYPIPCTIVLFIAAVVVGLVKAFTPDKPSTFVSTTVKSAPDRSRPDRSSPVESAADMAPVAAPARRDAGKLGIEAADANFSLPVFLDFAVLLYMRAIEAASTRKLGLIRPYVGEEALDALPKGGTFEDVCVGVATVTDARVSGDKIKINVRFEASMTRVAEDGTRSQLCTREKWKLVKKKGVLSKSPDDPITFACPSCGDTGEVRPDGTCKACDQVVTDGRYTWSVEQIHVEKRWTQNPDEVGSDSSSGATPPTVFDGRFGEEKRALLARYPGFSFDAFAETVKSTFLALQDAWTTRRFEKARPYESDAIFQTHRFWIESFKRHGRTNVLEDVRVTAVVPVKIARDAFHDAITVRVHFTMLDYTRSDATGAVLSGDSKSARAASEYWTFIRRSGFDPAAETRDPGVQCPSCGAPVQITLAGICEHCSAKVTSGKFGWVLSRIDQDSVYRG